MLVNYPSILCQNIRHLPGDAPLFFLSYSVQCAPATHGRSTPLRFPLPHMQRSRAFSFTGIRCPRECDRLPICTLWLASSPLPPSSPARPSAPEFSKVLIFYRSDVLRTTEYTRSSNFCKITFLGRSSRPYLFNRGRTIGNWKRSDPKNKSRGS